LHYFRVRSSMRRLARGPDRVFITASRVRRPLPGVLLFQDGSTHRWIAALGHDLDLIVTLDDATGEIYSAFLVEQEGTMSSLVGLAETVGRERCRLQFEQSAEGLPVRRLGTCPRWS
jgi:hypothetical protein